MLDLEPVPIAPCLLSRISIAPFNLIPITKSELVSSKPQRDGKRQSSLPNFAPAKWLHADVQDIR